MSLMFHHLSDIGCHRQTREFTGEDAEFISIQSSSSTGVDGILVVDKAELWVTWYSESGLRLIKRFHLSHTPTDAKFCEFQTDVLNCDESSSVESQRGQESLQSIAILLDNNDLQIHLYSGEMYEVHIPFVVQSMMPTKYGLMLQKKGVDDVIAGILHEVDDTACDDFYILRHPLSSLTPVVSDEQR